MMIQAFSALVIVCLAFSTAQGDVNTLCGADTCAAGTVCRVAQTTADGATSTDAHCLTCVPGGADATCNTNGFWRAVLAGDVNAPAGLTALACGEACPGGATCVEGVCCYGDNGSPVENMDAVCPL